jgi:hypothetical protein
MISDQNSARSRTRRGFSLMEVQVAFLTFGFSVAALFPFAVAQFRLVAALERRLPPNVSFAMVSRDHRMVNLLVAGGGSTAFAAASAATASAASQGPTFGGSVQNSTTTRAVVIESVASTGGMANNDYTATVVVKLPGGG